MLLRDDEILEDVRASAQNLRIIKKKKKKKSFSYIFIINYYISMIEWNISVFYLSFIISDIYQTTVYWKEEANEFWIIDVLSWLVWETVYFYKTKN